MSHITLSTSFPIPDGSNQLPSLAYLVSAIEGSSVGNLGRANMLSGERPITASASQPASGESGEHWLDMSGDTWLLKRFNGSSWVSHWHVAETAPEWTEPGLPWWDLTNNLLRVYGTQDGITGWHSSQPGYQLMTNRSGGSVSANRVVIRDNTGTSVREFSTTTGVKDQSVIGVLLEDTNSNASGLVALATSGAVVDILADDGEADGAILKGDGLATYSVAGECRTVGPLATSGYVSATNRSSGTPLGCFAVALGTKDATTHLVRARLLGYVGEGCTVTQRLTSFSGTVTQTGSGTSSWGAPTHTGHSSKHAPLVSARILVDPSVTGNCSGTISLSCQETAADYQFNYDSSEGVLQHFVEFPLVDDPSSPADLGQDVGVQVSNTTANEITVTLKSIGYTY